MRNIILLLLILCPFVLLGQAKKKHVHEYFTKEDVRKAGESNPELFAQIVGSDEFEPRTFIDSTSRKKYKYNIIVYVKKNYKCKICGEWYYDRINKDTFSTTIPPMYSNLKREQEKQQKKKE